MSIPSWEWEARGFDPERDLTPAIRQALRQERAREIIHNRWPWVPDTAVDEFVSGAFAVVGDDRRVLIERFQHTIRAEWSNRYEPRVYRRAPRRRWWHRYTKRGQ